MKNFISAYRVRSGVTQIDMQGCNSVDYVFVRVAPLRKSIVLLRAREIPNYADVLQSSYKEFTEISQ